MLPLQVSLAAALLLTGGLVADAGARQDPAVVDAPVLRVHDLRPMLMTERWQTLPADWRSMLTVVPLDSMEPEALPFPLEKAALGEGPSVVDSLGAYLRTALGAEEGEEDWTLAIDAGLLLVTAAPPVQEEIARALHSLEARVTRTASIEAYVLPREALHTAERSRLSSAEVARLLEAHAPLQRARARVPLGRVASLGAGAWRSLVYDYDVEIATRSELLDPQVAVVREGLQMGAMVNELAGGDWLLRTWMRNGRVTAIHTIELEPGSEPVLELPAGTSTRAAGSARLASGEGLLLGETWNEDGAVLVVVHGPERSDRGDWLPLAELTAEAQRAAPPWTVGPEPSGGLSVPDGSNPLFELDREREPAPTPSVALDILADVLGVTEVGLAAVPLDGALYLGPESPYAEGLRETLQQIAGSRARNVEVELRFGTRPLGGSTVGAPDPAELAGGLQGRLRGSCCAGDTLTLVGGDERLFLKDHDVEIAERALANDPIVSVLFQGVTAWCAPTLTQGGDLMCVVELEYQRQLDPWTRRIVAFGFELVPDGTDVRPDPERSLRTGWIEEVRTTRTDLSLVLRPDAGRWQLVARQSLPGTVQELVVVARFLLDGDA